MIPFDHNLTLNDGLNDIIDKKWKTIFVCVRTSKVDDLSSRWSSVPKWIYTFVCLVNYENEFCFSWYSWILFGDRKQKLDFLTSFFVKTKLEKNSKKPLKIIFEFHYLNRINLWLVVSYSCHQQRDYKNILIFHINTTYIVHLNKLNEFSFAETQFQPCWIAFFVLLISTNDLLQFQQVLRPIQSEIFIYLFIWKK